MCYSQHAQNFKTLLEVNEEEGSMEKSALEQSSLEPMISTWKAVSPQGTIFFQYTLHELHSECRDHCMKEISSDICHRCVLGPLLCVP